MADAARLQSAINTYLIDAGANSAKELKRALLSYKAQEVRTTEKPLTVMFTDIAGSSSIADINGDIFARQIVRIHNEIVRDIICKHNGTEINHTGDGMLITYPNRKNAISAAIEIQQKIRRHNLNYDLMPLHIGIGINTGTVLEFDQGNVYGSTINLAARVCAAAGSDRIFITRRTQKLNERKVNYQGEHSMKGFGKLVELFEVDW